MTQILEEVRCCCDPSNLIGMIPREVGVEAGLQLRELEEGGVAFDSNHDANHIRDLPGFVEAKHTKGKGGKTWKKTWRGK